MMTVSLDQSTPSPPSDVPVASLDRVRLQALRAGNFNESQKLFDACRTSEFLLLDLTSCQEGRTVLDDAFEIFEISKFLFRLGHDEKMLYHVGERRIYGYKSVGVGKIDNKGTPDRNEIWAMSKDGILNQFAEENVPSLIRERRSRLKSLAEHAHSICILILSYIEQSLGMMERSLTDLHKFHSLSEDSLRLLKMSSQPEGDRRTSFMAHTDFGSVTLLWNTLGGLQVQRPDGQTDEDSWEYVKPEPGCCIVNVGDALTIFTDEAVRSNLHRVVSPPGLQAQHDRYSVAYFCRPENDIHMKPLIVAKPVRPTSGSDADGTTDCDVHSRYTTREWIRARTDLFLRGRKPMRSHGGQVVALR